MKRGLENEGQWRGGESGGLVVKGKEWQVTVMVVCSGVCS